MSEASLDLVGQTEIPLVKLPIEAGSCSRRSTLTQREPPNPYKKKRKIVAFAAIVILGLTVWSCIAAYQVIKHLVWGPDHAVEATIAGAEIHVPKPDPILLSSIRWTTRGINSTARSGKKGERIACLVHAKRQRLHQVDATAKTWLPACDYHALLSFHSLPETLQSTPHILISHQSGLEKCMDRLALNLTTTLFPEADWVLLAPDDSFVLVDRLLNWLDDYRTPGRKKEEAYLDLTADGQPAMIVRAAVLGSLNITDCDLTEPKPVVILFKRNRLQSLPSVDAEKRPVILNKYKTDNQFSLSPHLSIVQKVSAEEMVLLNHIHSLRP